MKNKKVLNLPNKISIIRISLIPLIVLFALLQAVTIKKEVNYNSYYSVFINAKAGIYFAIPLILLYIAACVTDFFDGKIARKTNQVTTLGKFLDSLADKMLVLVMLILIVSLFDRVYSMRDILLFSEEYKAVNSLEGLIKNFMIITAIIIFIREFLVSGLRQMAATKNIIIQADKFGKIKTFATMITIGFNLLVPFGVLRVHNKFLYGATEAHNRAVNAQAIFEFFVALLWLACLVLTIFSAYNYFKNNYRVLLDDSDDYNFSQKQIVNAEIVSDNKKDENNVVIEADIVDKK